jgi:hypothetical protein
MRSPLLPEPKRRAPQFRVDGDPRRMMVMSFRRYASILAAMIIIGAGVVPSWAGPQQRVRGMVLVPEFRLATSNVESTCGVASATTYWAVRKTLPCKVTPQNDNCARANTPQGLLRFRFAVDPSTYGRSFSLRSTARLADLAIVFRGASTTRVDTRDLLWSVGPERGTVPVGATMADVCLVDGLPTTFTYVAG